MFLYKYDDKVNFKLCVQQIYQKGDKHSRFNASGKAWPLRTEKLVDNFFKTSILSVIQEDRLKFPVAFLRYVTDYKDSADTVRK